MLRYSPRDSNRQEAELYADPAEFRKVMTGEGQNTRHRERPASGLVE